MWNPSKEVAVARDAASQLDDAPIVVILYVTKDGSNLGMATYGKTKALCASAAQLGSHVYEAAQLWGEECR
jgi:hypothetical protein